MTDILVLDWMPFWGMLLIALVCGLVFSTASYALIRKERDAVGISAFVGVAVAVLSFVPILIVSENPVEERTASFHEQYPGLAVIMVNGKAVEDVDQYLIDLVDDANSGVIPVALVFEDGSEHPDAFLAFERGDRNGVSHLVSLGNRNEETTEPDAIIHSTDQLTEVNGNGETLTDQISERKLEEELPESHERFWNSSAGEFIKWTGAIGGALAVSTFFVNFGMKISKDRANKVRTKMREKA